MFYYIIAIFTSFLIIFLFNKYKFFCEMEEDNNYYLWSKRVLELNTYNLK